MGPVSVRWSDMEEDNTQVPLELLPLEDALTHVLLASWTAVETTQDQGVGSLLKYKCI